MPPTVEGLLDDGALLHHEPLRTATAPLTRDKAAVSATWRSSRLSWLLGFRFDDFERFHD
jgi:hypothetical protein